MSTLNQYSFVIIALLLMSLVAWIIYKNGFGFQKLVLFIALLAGLISIWLAIKPVQNLTTSQDSSQAWIGGGKPVLLEFQSPY